MFIAAKSVPMAKFAIGVIKFELRKKIAENLAICAEKVSEAGSALNYFQETL